MALALIKLTYKHTIDASAQTAYEKDIFHSTYLEFRSKSQVYNPEGKMKTFTEFKAKDHRANSLHYKMSVAAQHFLAPLRNKIPVLCDELGGQLQYDSAVFELVESDITEIANHKVAIKFITGTYVLHQVIGNHLVLSLEDVFKQTNEFAETFMISIQPGLAVSSYRELTNHTVKDMLKTSFNNN